VDSYHGGDASHVCFPKEKDTKIRHTPHLKQAIDGAKANESQNRGLAPTG
jgi:hypothetical protein